jgi:hypothetical protein
MTDDTSISKAKTDVENWRRGYEAALAGKAFLCADGERTSAWRLGYRDGRALRLKLRLALAGSTIAAALAGGRQAKTARLHRHAEENPDHRGCGRGL